MVAPPTTGASPPFGPCTSPLTARFFIEGHVATPPSLMALSTANATAVCQHLRKHWNHAEGVWRVGDGDKKVRTFKGIASYGNLQTPLNAELQRCNTLLLGGGKELEYACTYVSGLAVLEREGLAHASKLCALAT